MKNALVRPNGPPLCHTHIHTHTVLNASVTYLHVLQSANYYSSTIHVGMWSHWRCSWWTIITHLLMCESKHFFTGHARVNARVLGVHIWMCVRVCVCVYVSYCVYSPVPSVRWAVMMSSVVPSACFLFQFTCTTLSPWASNWHGNRVSVSATVRREKGSGGSINPPYTQTTRDRSEEGKRSHLQGNVQYIIKTTA